MKLVVTNGYLYAEGLPAMRCAMGKAGLTQNKREGDNCTPAGTFPLRGILYRPDRVSLPEIKLLALPISPYDGWCDDALHEDYNRHIKLPHPARHEQLWRDDHVYDIIIPLGYNDDPVVSGKGSAIFFHLAHEDYRGTEGCVAISRDDMLALLGLLEVGAVMEIVV